MSTLTVRAIYNYTARNKRELSFSAGEILQVTEKSGDGNWWDGFCDTRRGYIPVTYVEIVEVHSTLLPSYRDDSPQPKPASSPIHLPLSPTHLAPSVRPKDIPAPAKPETMPQVRSIENRMAEFLSSLQPQPAGPSTTPASLSSAGHHRMKFEGSNLEYRNVKQLTQAYNPDTTEKGHDYPLPPTRPKRHPSAELIRNKEVLEQTINFPIMPHTETFQVSPLMQKVFSAQTELHSPPPPQQQHQQQSRPAVLTKPKGFFRKQPRKITKPDPPSQTTVPPKGGFAPIIPEEPPSQPQINFPEITYSTFKPAEVNMQMVTVPSRPKDTPAPATPKTMSQARYVSPLHQKLFSAQTDPPPQQQQQQQPKPAVLTKPKGSFLKQPKKITKPPPSPPANNPRDFTALYEELRAVASARTRKTDKDSRV